MSDLNQDAIESLIRRHRELGSLIAELKGEQDQIRQTVDDNVPVGWSMNVDGVKASKREPNRSFDLVTAVSLLSAEAKAKCVLTSYEPKLVRAAVEESGQLDACMLVSFEKQAVVKL